MNSLFIPLSCTHFLYPFIVHALKCLMKCLMKPLCSLSSKVTFTCSLFPFQGSTLPGAGNTMESKTRCGPALLELTGYCSVSHVRFFAAPWTAACQASRSFTISWSLLKLIFIESVMQANHLVLCRSLLLLPSIFPSIRVFSNESALHSR